MRTHEIARNRRGLIIWSLNLRSRLRPPVSRRILRTANEEPEAFDSRLAMNLDPPTAILIHSGKRMRIECQLGSLDVRMVDQVSAPSCVFTNITKGKPYETNYIIDRHRCSKLHHIGVRPRRGNSIPCIGGNTIHYRRRNSDACARGEGHCNARRATSRSEKRKTRSACVCKTHFARGCGAHKKNECGSDVERAREQVGGFDCYA